jgi:hypothetical protein
MELNSCSAWEEIPNHLQNINVHYCVHKNLGGRLKGPANLPVGVAILPENVPQEHQLHMKAVLITQSSSPVYQCGKYSMLVE